MGNSSVPSDSNCRNLFCIHNYIGYKEAQVEFLQNHKKAMAMEITSASRTQPHLVLLCFPMIGHTNPMLQFAKNITRRGVMTTLVTFSHGYPSPLQPKDSLDSTGLPIQFETISDGLSEGETLDYVEILRHLANNLDGSDFESLIRKLNSDKGKPPVCYVVYNHFIPWARKVALKMGIAHAMFWTQPASVFSIFHHYFFDSDPSLSREERATKIPGLDLSLEWSDLPGSFNMEEYLPTYKHHIGESERVAWVLANTVYELEEDAFDYIRSQSIRIGGIGPCLPTAFLGGYESDSKVGLKYYKESDSCIQWLDSQPDNSVMYISFGSITMLSKTQVEEMAMGIKQSGQRFLWIGRGMDDMIPHGFVEETRDRGLLVKWCSQLQVLFHPSIGGFLSHCGWNSTLEAICAGVPIATFGIWADQPVNSKIICEKWGIGVKIQRREDGVVRREEVERCIRALLCEVEPGMKDNVKKWKHKTKMALSSGGSSDVTLSAFVQDVVSEAEKNPLSSLEP